MTPESDAREGEEDDDDDDDPIIDNKFAGGGMTSTGDDRIDVEAVMTDGNRRNLAFLPPRTPQLIFLAIGENSMSATESPGLLLRRVTCTALSPCNRSTPSAADHVLRSTDGDGILLDGSTPRCGRDAGEGGTDDSELGRRLRLLDMSISPTNSDASPSCDEFIEITEVLSSSSVTDPPSTRRISAILGKRILL